MEKNILPEISHWKNKGIFRCHDFIFNSILEKQTCLNLIHCFGKEREYSLTHHSGLRITVCFKIKTDAGECKYKNIKCK